MESLPYVLEVGTQEVVLTPDPAHEFTATTEQVALGYGVSPEAIRSLKLRRDEELLEGKHWVVADRNTPGGTQQLTLWTKRGIVRLGFFIRSARARLFRDMAEDLVISAMSPSAPVGLPALISMRAVAAGLDCTSKSARNRLCHAGIEPTHHFFEPLCKAPAYLYPLDDVQARWPALVFQPFQGVALPGVRPVVQAVSASITGKVTKKHRPRLIPTDTSTEQLARRLLSLEAQKREVLRELAALA